MNQAGTRLFDQFGQFRLARLTVGAALLACLGSCSLVSLKSPEKPLSTRDLNARILTHEYSAHFITAVQESADQIYAANNDSQVRRNALRWKIAVADRSERAASQIAPMMGLLDSWALAVQMQQYLAQGDGDKLFAGEQSLAVSLASELSAEIEGLAKKLCEPKEFEQYRQFVDDYARENPFKSLDFDRPSIVDRWADQKGAKSALVDSVGTVPEALADAGDLLRMYGGTASSQMLWKAQLAAQDAGLGGNEVQTSLRDLERRVAQLSDLASGMPGRVQGMVDGASERFNASWGELLHTLHTESGTLTTSLRIERVAAVDAVDKERAAVAVDASRIAAQVISQAGEELRRALREALLLVIVLTVIALGLPFTAGYLLGRARRRSDS
ncbi:MAG TPA: hypothetical protein VGL28_03885 [Steroidobacteraceae bacterium]|jgi:hypothetical protein